MTKGHEAITFIASVNYQALITKGPWLSYYILFYSDLIQFHTHSVYFYCPKLEPQHKNT